MARPITPLPLPAADQSVLEDFTRTGCRPVRAVRRALVLLARWALVHKLSVLKLRLPGSSFALPKVRGWQVLYRLLRRGRMRPDNPLR